ncbi:hypothetical protein JFU47_27965 [Pseudomonas sp. TH39(2020)]|uniref:hypothetical protein n=1 Tax=Pseudomonas sp. TH39(2020) TaxID=2796349 RepID=UPI001913F86F|nr:hypothetical protein [Pseudomonas sp. TH39(2020)]MBK5400511.1 hypothetical protein [Pseudomonas sp. TH39(2020)]
MAKGDILKAALSNPNRGPHQTALIRSAIYKEMEQFTATRRLPPSLDASEICRILAPIDRHLTPDDYDRLHKFSDFLAVIDTSPNAHPGYHLLGEKLSADLGL